jgi:hypothetical protein
VAKEEKGTRFTDFAYYMKNVEWFWFSDHPTIYQIDTQSRIFSDLVNAETNKVMLPHLTPVALIFWMPLAWISSKNSAAAHALWMGISFTVYFASAYRAYNALRSTDSSRRIFLILLYFLSTLSFSTLMNVTTGQTSIFICGVLVLLGTAMVRKSGDSCPESQWWIILGLTVLAIKPHYYLFGIVLASAFKRRQEVLYSAGIVLGVFLLLSIRLGLMWPFEYIEILSIHSQPEPPKSSEDFILLDTMFNFRGVFYPVLGYRGASLVSMLTFGIIAIGTLLTSFFYGWVHNKKSQLAFPSMMITNLLLGSYLLLSPHIYPYEDILIVTIATFAILANPRPFGFNILTAGILIASTLQVNPVLFGNSRSKLLYWFIKFFCWVVLLYVTSLRSNDSMVKASILRKKSK